MDSEEDEVSNARPVCCETTGDSAAAAATATEAAKPSPASARRGGGSKRRTVEVSGSVRVLRSRRAGAGGTGEPEHAACKKTTTIVQKQKQQQRGGGGGGGRGRPAGGSTSSRSKNSPGVQPVIKKSTAKKAAPTSSASKHALEPKLSKSSRRGKARPATRASRTKPPATTTACKPEAEMEASSCGEETGAVKGSDDNVADSDAALDEDPPFRDDPNDLIYEPETKTEKPRRRTTAPQKEVKKEESEREEEEEESDVKKERPRVKIVIQRRRKKDDKAPRLPKRRKKPPVQYVRCEMEGCGTVLAHPRYLQHHIKYQHLLKKKYVCDHPSCGRLFRLQKQLLRHAKHHTDQRDYICEYCARAFKSSHNLAVHRMIHTGEKPIQCEICGFTCRQKASLNWHMKKHDAEASYQFSCSICSKKFEKKDSVVAHKAKSHPEVLIAEALAANGGAVISSPAPIPETVPVLAQPDQLAVSQESQEAASGALTPLQQVVLPLTPQTQLGVPQFLQLPAPHVVHVAHQQQTPTLLHLTTAAPALLSNASHAQLIQLSALTPTVACPMSTADPQSTLLTLSSVTTLAPAASLAPQQAAQWGREAPEETPLPGEGELWDRVVVGSVHQDVGEMMWEGSGERRKEDEGIVWEREGERQILLQCAEVHRDGLI